MLQTDETSCKTIKTTRPTCLKNRPKWAISWLLPGLLRPKISRKNLTTISGYFVFDNDSGVESMYNQNCVWIYTQHKLRHIPYRRVSVSWRKSLPECAKVLESGSGCVPIGRTCGLETSTFAVNICTLNVLNGLNNAAKLLPLRRGSVVRMSVSGRRTFPDPCPSYGWQVTTVRYGSSNQANSSIHPSRVGK